MIHTLLFFPMMCLVPDEGKTNSDAETLVKRGPWVVSSLEQDGKAFSPPEDWAHLLRQGDVVTFTKTGAQDNPLDVAVKRGKRTLSGWCTFPDNAGKPTGDMQLSLSSIPNAARAPILTGTHRIEADRVTLHFPAREFGASGRISVVVILKRARS